MRTAIFIFAIMTLFSACQNEPRTQKTEKESALFTVQTDAKDLEYENLRLLPILATDAFIQQNAAATELINLQEALAEHRFRITEQKPFGRRDDEQAVNGLLVHNKTEAPVFLMAGEVVQGGQQDRVIAEDVVVMARSLSNIPVYCVEPGRWTYRETEGETTTDKKIYAFNGYYNVASPQVRKSAQFEHDQAAVWKHVAAITEKNDATSKTGAYAGLEQSETFTKARDQYLDFFKNKFAESDKVIGIVAISGTEIISTEVFAHPTLFKKQYEALLHGYATHALTTGAPVNIRKEGIDLHIKNLPSKYRKNAASQYKGMALHWGEL